MIKNLFKFTLLILFFLPGFAIASVPIWKMVPAESNLTFTATQNGAPISGKFKTFSADINFDPDQLSASQVKIIVEIGSLSAADNELIETLKTPEWFNLQVFPQAIFQSNKFVKTADKNFQATGTLTIRNVTQPLTLTFTQIEYTPTKAIIKGSTTIKRTAFGIGQGEWADTNAIKDNVEVNFTITALKN